MPQPESFTVHTPRRSRLGRMMIILLLVVSVGLLAFAYWGWQRHVEQLMS